MAELAIEMRGRALRARREHDRDVALAWHLAALSRSRRLPSLARLLRRPDRHEGKVDPEEQMEALEEAEAALAEEERRNREAGVTGG